MFNKYSPFYYAFVPIVNNSNLNLNLVIYLLSTVKRAKQIGAHLQGHWQIH